MDAENKIKTDKRNAKSSKKSILFYQISACIFWSMCAFTFAYCCIHGFSDVRIVLMLMNGWFGLFTMNMMTIRFRRNNEKQFWYDWSIFQRKSQSGFDIVPELLDKPLDNQTDKPQSQQDDTNKKDVA